MFYVHHDAWLLKMAGVCAGIKFGVLVLAGDDFDGVGGDAIQMVEKIDFEKQLLPVFSCKFVQNFIP